MAERGFTVPFTPDSNSRSPPDSDRRRVRRIAAIIAITVIVTVAAVTLTEVPLMQKEFSGSVVTYQCADYNVACMLPAEVPSLHSFPWQSSVSVVWGSAIGVPIQFSVIDPSDHLVTSCSQFGMGGSCSFQSIGGSYRFDVAAGNQTVIQADFNGTFTAPVL